MEEFEGRKVIFWKKIGLFTLESEEVNEIFVESNGKVVANKEKLNKRVAQLFRENQQNVQCDFVSSTGALTFVFL